MVRQGSALLVTGCGQARTIDLASGEVLQRSEHPALALVDDMTASDDGRFAVNHDADHRVQVFSHRGTLALSPLMGIEQPAISLSRDGRKLAMGGYLDRKVSVFDLDPRTSIRVADSNAGEEVIAFDFCPDRSQAFWGRDDGRLFSLDGDIEAGGRSRITNWSGSGSRVDLLRCLPGGGVIVQRRNLAVEHWLAPARMKTLVEEGGSSEGLSAGSTRRVAYALGPGHVVRWEADPQGMLKELPRLPLPLPEAGWKTLTLGRDDKLLALGSYNGDLAILDAASGRPVITPRRISWSNVWTLSRDVADRGFIAAGAGTGVSLFDWQGQSVRRFELDRFTFAAQPAYDSRRGLVAIQSAAGEVLVRDLQGNDIGPPIRPSTHDGIAVLQFTRDGRLFTVDPDYGVSAHEFAPRRLLTLACQLLNRRHIQAAESGTPTASVATGDCTPRR